MRLYVGYLAIVSDDEVSITDESVIVREYLIQKSIQQPIEQSNCSIGLLCI